MQSVNALSQEDIDALFQSQAAGVYGAGRTVAQRYDFRRSDRIPKEQIRAVRTVHDTFARGLASSLSAYLRTYVTVNLISVEQLSFREFTGCLSSPTSLSVMRIRPFDGIAILELNTSLALPMIEIMLGGGKVKAAVVQRELTVIEQHILNNLVTLILQNLSLAWQSVATVEFAVDSYETEPGLLHVLPPNEAVVSIATEVQVGESSGMMNIGIPASAVKLLRQKFDQQWTARRAVTSEEETRKTLAHIGDSVLKLDARIEGSVVRFDDLLQLAEGDILQFEQKTTEPLSILVNGLLKYQGKVMLSGGRKAISIESKIHSPALG